MERWPILRTRGYLWDNRDSRDSPPRTVWQVGNVKVDFLKRLTHLKLGEMGIAKIEALEVCERLRNLYLFDNTISRIENLSFARHLTHLYLQNNRISKIEGLDRLTNLSKLYLGGNAIHTLEGLDNLPREYLCLAVASTASASFLTRAYARGCQYQASRSWICHGSNRPR